MVSKNVKILTETMIQKLGGEQAFADVLVDIIRSGALARENQRKGRGPHGEHTCWAAVRIVIEKEEEGE
jgi:hypothetical protein